jgi:hypothetical protein
VMVNWAGATAGAPLAFDSPIRVSRVVD